MRAENRESRTENRESRIENREPRTENRESRIKTKKIICRDVDLSRPNREQHIQRTKLMPFA
ncbi:MAG: hypothetical protein E6Q38_01140 [Crocinitomicaceae bacterium]|nr:MAG: hypothetical protein E6Q38_01140 [Crocinitomicaceae bacterium]